MKNTLIRLSFLICLMMGFQWSHSQPDNSTFIKAGKLFDSEKGVLLADQVIKINRNRISEVGTEISIPEGSTIIDLSEHTVLPGLIDAHTHMMTLEDLNLDHPMGDKLLFEGDALRVLRGAKRAKSWLDNGFTTIKDLGDSGAFLDVALKKAINEGTMDGPRMFVSGPIIISEGGQVPGLVYSHRNVIEDEYTIIKNVDEAINAVRKHLTYGADLIKICANNTPNVTSLTIDEMKAIVKMAHRYNVKVTAHATDDRAIWEAVTAGVDGIEHGYQVSDTTLTLMAKKGVVLVPTDISRPLFSKLYDIVDFQWDREKNMQRAKDRYTDRLQRAIKAGVTIVTGSDNYLDLEMPQGEAAKHILIAYHEEGMTSTQILQSSTYLSAKFMGRENELGVIKKGAYADIIAVKGDIENDFDNAMFNMVMVMKDGKIYVDNDKLVEEIFVADNLLRSYEGQYQLNPDMVITVAKNGRILKAGATGQGEYDFYPKDQNVFYSSSVNLQLTFNKNGQDEIESLTLLAGGEESLCPKIKE
ncbi:MAG: amidohydrolase family protein [Flavobacteriaceae bacterium]|nr:amidohydrolase family protein [Flavobacteriaceae bacterium]